MHWGVGVGLWGGGGGGGGGGGWGLGGGGGGGWGGPKLNGNMDREICSDDDTQPQSSPSHV